MKLVIFIFLFTLTQLNAQLKVAENTDVSFNKLILFNKYISEGASIGDMDADGNEDVIAGSLWWKGPDFNESYSYAPVKTFPIIGPGLEGYATNFFTYHDYINDDNWIDIVQIGLPGTDSHWIQNPGRDPFKSSNIDGVKIKYKAQNHICNESPQFLDIIGDSEKELLAFSNGKITLGIPNISGEAWQVISISHHDPKRFSVNAHGLGSGDINMDGKMDILEKSGWWEQPKDWDLTSEWIYHSYPFSSYEGGAQMYAFDIDGDSDNDVITSLNAHGYGMSWHEQIKVNGKIEFIEHQIMSNKNVKNQFGVSFSQLHAMALADFDNDGINDIVTGKCYYAHNGRDPGGKDAAVLYWFKTKRKTDGNIEMIPYLIDENSGVGRQISTGDLNKDGKIDIVVSNKKGVFAFIQK